MRPAPTSQPASGSVSTMVAPQRFSTIELGPLLLRLVAWSSMMPAKAGPEEYIHTAGFAPRIISAHAQISERGEAVPPIASGRPRRQYSESMKACSSS